MRHNFLHGIRGVIFGLNGLLFLEGLDSSALLQELLGSGLRFDNGVVVPVLF